MTGRLDLALEQVANYLERDLETRSQINQALAYPSVVLGMAGVTVSVLAVWVLPKFAKFFSSLGAKLPLTTRILIGTANFTANYWWLYLVGFLGVGLMGAWVFKTETGRRLRNRATLAHAAGQGDRALFGGGTGHADPGRDVAGRRAAPRRDGGRDPGCEQQRVRGRVGGRAGAHARRRGPRGPISDTGLFPEAAIQMMRVGENTGTLDTQLENASDYYSRELGTSSRSSPRTSSRRSSSSWDSSSASSPSPLVQAMYGIYSAPTLTNLK